MNETQNLETELKKIMHARWSVKRPSANLESNVQQKLAARRARKRVLQIVSATAFSVAALLITILIFTIPRLDALQMIRGVISNPNAPSTLFTAFECPTPNPLPLTRFPQPTAAPQPTIDPNVTLTPKPTRVKKTRVPRPTAPPTPTIVFLAANQNWKSYQDSKYGFSFEYPATWYKQDMYQMRGLLIRPAGTFVTIRNYLLDIAPARNPPEALTIHVNLSPAFCGYDTLKQAVNHSAMTESSPLMSRASVGGFPAWQHTIHPPYENSSDWLEVVVPRGKWLYRFQADPADSQQLAAFEHLLDSFSSP